MRLRGCFWLLLFTFVLQALNAIASDCVLEQVRANLAGAALLHRLDPSLHHSPMAKRAETILVQLGDKNPQNSQKKIAAWLTVIEQTHLGHKDQPQVLDRLKQYYHREHVLSEHDFPESYFELQKKIAREQGHGNIEIGPSQRAELMRVAIEDQKKSLDRWIEYLTSSDARYPMWAKVWAFDGMTRVAKLDAKTGLITRRGKDTVAPFIELNRDALALTIEAVENFLKAKQKNLNYAKIERDPELRKLVQSGNFGPIYAWYQRALTQSLANLEVTEGIWVKYPKGSDPAELIKSLECKNTKWCTANFSTAQTHLQGGDFYIYYSQDTFGRHKNPRVAIRMQDNRIAEVRGIGSSQELDPSIAKTSVVEQKLKEFGSEGARYLKRSSDMKQLTQIEHKVAASEELTEPELRFLYEIDSKIDGFGSETDPRIGEIRATRDIKKDLSRVFHIKPEEISLTRSEALSGKAKVHYGNLSLKLDANAFDLSNFDLPDFEHKARALFLEHKKLSNLTSGKDLKLPKHVIGDLNLSGLTSARGLKLPERVTGALNLGGLKSARSLKLPENVGGDLFLYGLKSAEGLALPENLGGALDLSSLTSARGLNLPENLRGDLLLGELKSTEGLKLPEHLEGSLELYSIKSTVGLKLPNSVGGGVFLGGLKSAEGLKFPEHADGGFDLSGLISARGLKLPENLSGDLYLSGLKSAEGLQLPRYVEGDLDLSGLKSIVALKLPEHVGGELDLSGLTSTRGLVLPVRFKQKVKLKPGIEPHWIE